MQEEFTPVENSDNIIINKSINSDNINSVTFDKVAGIFDDEKGSNTIDKELKEFNDFNNEEREEINDKINHNADINLDDLDSTENSSAFDGLDDLDSLDIDDTAEQLEDEVEEQQSELEDFFGSAEFVIWIMELIMVFGMNFYLKRNQLDSIGIEAFNKTAREQKFLVKSWAKVLQKRNAKVSPEMELLFALGSTYVMKLKGIVEAQKLRKEKADFEALKNSKKKGNKKNRKNGKVVDITNHQKESPIAEEKEKKKTKINKDNFKLEKDKEIEEVEEVEVAEEDEVLTIVED